MALPPKDSDWREYSLYVDDDGSKKTDKGKEPDLTNWSDWNKYTEDMQKFALIDFKKTADELYIQQQLDDALKEVQEEEDKSFIKFAMEDGDLKLNKDGDLEILQAATPANFSWKNDNPYSLGYDVWSATTTTMEAAFKPERAKVEELLKEHVQEAKAAKVKRPRYPAYKKNDRVTTPGGPGNVWSVDKDGTVCVELDNDSTVLHEFEKKELKKIK